MEDHESENLTENERKSLQTNFVLAEKLGAEIVTLSGADAPTAIAEYIQLSGITNIVVGKSQKKLFFKTAFEDQILAITPNIEVHIIPDTRKFQKERRKWHLKDNLYFSWWDLLKTFFLIIAATFFLLA